jgi:uncharacterized protein YaiE (UPF0345 family)
MISIRKIYLNTSYLVTVYKGMLMFKTNEYFDGNVKSIAFITNGTPATVGVMAAGEYTFSTSSIELMTVTSGAMQVKLPDTKTWVTYPADKTFRVEANQSFNVKIESDTTYLCLYKEQ